MKYVYLANIEGTDIYKIGFTKKNPIKRIEELQTGNPQKIVLTSYHKSKMAPEVESVMHRFNVSKKYNSEDGRMLLGEWFQLNSDDVAGFKNQCEKIEEGLRVIKENSTLY
jgi:hypothetical protein